MIGDFVGVKSYSDISAEAFWLGFTDLFVNKVYDLPNRWLGFNETVSSMLSIGSSGFIMLLRFYL